MKIVKAILTAAPVILLLTGTCLAAEAAAGAAAAGEPMAAALRAGLIAIAVAFGLGLSAAIGTFAQSRATAAAMDAIGRNPDSAATLFVPLIIGLSFMESLVLYMLVVGFILQAKM
jgi:F-type H+-transporting ATPase subunit c